MKAKIKRKQTYLGNEARRSARNFVSKSVIEPNCFKDISHSSSGSGWIGFLNEWIHSKFRDRYCSMLI